MMSDPIKQSLLKAQKCVDDKEYSNALSHFDYVLRRVKNGEMHLDTLDRRAATYIRLRRFQDAYQDAKTMIRVHRKDTRSYLRTIQVLRYQAREKNDDAHLHSALKVAKSGLAHADKDANASRYMQLVRTADELTSQCTVKRLDPVEVLPLELFIGVFQCMNVPDRLVCRRVSRRWNQVISKTPQLWKSFSFRSTRRRGQVWNAHGIQAGLRLATDAAGKCHVTELDMTFSQHEGAAPRLEKEHHLLISVLKQTSRLRSLRLDKWQVRPTDDPLALPWKQLTCPDLRTLTVDLLTPRLENCGQSVLFAWLSGVLHNLPNLERLLLCSTDWYNDSAAPGSGMIWPQTTKLKSFQLQSLNNYDFAASALNLGQLALCAPHLEELDVFPMMHQQSDDSPEPDLLRFFSPFQHLKSLRLQCIPDGVFALLPSTLEHLRLDGRGQTYTLQSMNLEVTDRPLIPRLKSLETNLLQWPGPLLPLLQASECKLEALVIQVEGGYDPMLLVSQLNEAGVLTHLADLTLKLNFHYMIQDRDAEMIAKKLPNLRQIVFDGESLLTGVGMHTLVTNLKHLRFLDVGRSPKANVDVIPFFRNRGITLKGKIGEELKEAGQGRKLRFA